MNRQQAKELLPVIQAFAEGKEVEIKGKESAFWDTLKGDDMQYIDFEKCDLRIKPKYRPFKNNTECWEEMQKHQPFGWVKYKETKSLIKEVSSICVEIDKNYYFFEAIEVFTFADGTPFGIKD